MASLLDPNERRKAIIEAERLRLAGYTQPAADLLRKVREAEERARLKRWRKTPYGRIGR